MTWAGEAAPLVNGMAACAGAALGTTIGLRGLHESIRTGVMQAVALAVVAIGLTMTLGGSPSPLVLVAAMVVGTLVGESLRIEERLDHGAERLRARFSAEDGFTQGFTLATLIFCVGPLSILGALASGLRDQGGLLYAKSLLDGVTALFLATTFGWGVALAGVAVFVYEGLIALGASALAGVLTPVVITGLTQAGGLLVVAIGINILLGSRIRVANMLPALVFGALFAYLNARLGLRV